MKNLTLKHPIKLSDNKTITELVFKSEATAGDMLAFDTPGQNAQTIALIASLTNTDESIIKRLNVIDYRAADKIVEALLFPDKETAEKKELES